MILFYPVLFHRKQNKFSNLLTYAKNDSIISESFYNLQTFLIKNKQNPVEDRTERKIIIKIGLNLTASLIIVR